MTRASLNEGRQAVVASLVLMELKRLRAVGQPMPNRIELLRPEIARLVQAYSSWIHLEGDEAEVRVVWDQQIFHVPRQTPEF